MRRVYALLRLVQRYGPERVNHTCQIALDAELLDVKRLERMLKLGHTTRDPRSTSRRDPTRPVPPASQSLRDSTVEPRR